MNSSRKTARIKELIARLNNGNDVTNKDLRAVLTAEQFESIGTAWSEEKKARKPAKPPEIKHYETLLKTALLHNAKYERMYGKRVDTEKTTQQFDLAVLKFERALEDIQEKCDSNPALLIWLDRRPKDCDPCWVGMPRVVTSKSNENKFKSIANPMLGQKKHDLKLIALQNALEALTGVDSGAPPALMPPMPIGDFSNFKF